jgi:tRNA threonylcarbamoyladenosine biosynthesis protein TsaB
MKFLALDTSTEYCSAALWLEGRVEARRALAGQAHSALLLPMIDALLADAGTALAALDGIAFGAGPGSFTGLRIACAVTQGLALGADLPVFGVSTLESIAEQSGGERVLSALDARMAEVYWAAYERCDGGWKAVREPVLSLPEAVAVPDAREWIGAGNGFAVLPASALPALARIDAGLWPDAASIARLAAPALAAGRGYDAARAAPVYLRDKVALTVAERRQRQRA